MTIPTLSDEQRRVLGRLIWDHIDGVTENVHLLLHAINRDVVCGVRVVATQEWEKASAALRTLQDLAKHLEATAPATRLDTLVAQIRECAGTAIERTAPQPVPRTPVC